MTRWIKVFATKPDNLNSVLRMHVMDGKNNKMQQVILWSPHHTVTPPPTNTHKSVKKIRKKMFLVVI